MSQSLDSLARTLQPKDFVLLRQHFSHVTDELFQKLTEKGYFLYSFSDSFRNLMSPCQLSAMPGATP